MIGSFFVLYIYNPFQVKVVGPTWPKLQIQQGSTLQGLDLIIFNNFVSSAARARGAQPYIILNFASYTARLKGLTLDMLRCHHVPRLLRRHHLFQVWFNLDHLDYFHDIIYFKGDSTATTSTTSTTTREASLTNTGQEGLGLHWRTSTSSLSSARERVWRYCSKHHDEHFSYIDSWSKVWSRTKSEACTRHLEVVTSTWRQSNRSRYM
jgi:hypothetical protein